MSIVILPAYDISVIIDCKFLLAVEKKLYVKIIGNFFFRKVFANLTLGDNKRVSFPDGLHSAEVS